MSVSSTREHVTVIVPTLNEVENIESLLAGIFQQTSDTFKIDVLFVDDGSTDGTREKILLLAATHPVSLLERASPEGGLTGAVLAGARQVVSEWIVVMDADLSHPPDQIGELLRPLLARTSDMVIGSRYTPGGRTPGWPVSRRILSRGAATLAWPLTEVRDSMSGFFAVRRELLIALGPEVSGGFKIGLEILVRGGANLRVCEIPIVFKDRTKGKSKMSGRVISIYLRQLLGFFIERVRRLSPTSAVVLALWCVVLIVICVRTTISPHKNTVFATYEAAGLHWRTGGKIYINGGGFVYSPVIAAFFAPFSMLPDALSNVLWRLLNVFVFTGGVWWWLRRGLHEGIPKTRYSMVFLLLLPLAIGNFNNGQVNPMVIGLLMMAVVAAKLERWWLAAFCITITTYFKIYPIVLGMLLMVMFPKKLTWRLAATLVALGGLAFLLQRPAYVMGQYEAWWTTRLNDNRHLYDVKVAPRDLWRLLQDLHLAVSANAYKVIQVGTGAGIALYAVIGRWRNRPLNQTLVAVFTLATCWMLLLGPASESATYILLAPVVVLEFLSELDSHSFWWLRVLLVGALMLLLLGLAVNSFTHANRHPQMMILQPIAAVMFSLYVIFRLFAARSLTTLPQRSAT